MDDKQIQNPVKELSNANFIPLVGFGLYKIENPEQLEKIIRKALDVGYRHFDTAKLYQNEKIIGDVFKKIFEEGKYKRSDIFLTTKQFMQKEKSLVECLQEQLADLQTDYVDLYLIHWPTSKPNSQDIFEHKPVHKSWPEMENCVQLGLTKTIGVSNFNVQSLVDLLSYCQIKPVVNQVEFHIYLQQKEFLVFCKRFGILVTAYCPLVRGGEVMKDPVLVRIAEKYKKTVAQIMLNYLCLELGVAVIPKTQNVERVEENFLWRDFRLDQSDIQTLASLDRNQRIVLPETREFIGYLALFS